MKLLVAVPTVDYVHAEFMKCLVGLEKKLLKDGVDVSIEIVGGTLVYITNGILRIELPKAEANGVKRIAIAG